ncbi:MAG: PEPxxWA-CTERM sorting domain-containing protein [Novosphingobium sp.]
MSKLLAASAALAVSQPATAAEFVFSFDLSGSPVITGGFSFNDSLTGVLGYGDLDAFSISLAGQTYDLADVGSLTNFQYFAFDTSTSTFVSAPITGVFGSGTGTFTSILSAATPGLNGDPGFFITPTAGGQYIEYITSIQGSYDTVTIEAVGGAVPEPASWGMMLLGLFAVGSAMRHRPARPARVSFAL